MTVNSYLTTRASSAVLSAGEKFSIATSIETLRKRLNSYFGDRLSEHFTFGSFTRGTILPRSMDQNSDIDYMVVFNEGGYTPQTYLNRLKVFVERYYQASEIRQSSPTIVLELNHIKFELVPALGGAGTYQIPAGPNQWQQTNPNDFNHSLSERNKACHSLLKPTVRLLKFWNAENGYVFESYPLERWMADDWYLFCYDLKDHLFHAVERAQLDWGAAQWRKDRLSRAKEIVEKTRGHMRDDMPASAELEVKKLIPV